MIGIIRVITGLVVLVAVAVIGGVVYKRFDRNKRCCLITTAPNISLSLRETFGITTYPSQSGQDKWVALTMFPGIMNGFFLDVGSGDGYIHSNTQALEAKGWKGICIDPFPQNMDGRTCQIFKNVVSNKSGKTVVFHVAGEYGGIADTLGMYKDQVIKTPAVTLTTTTLDEILARAQAPTFIHFMSLDIEGGELDALRGLSLDRYRFGAMAIEHNFEEPKRTQIRELLEQHGYVLVHTYQQDDFYAPAAAR
jgi:FkbM family methyltransferase